MNTDTDNSWQGSVTDDQPQNSDLFDRLDGISQNHNAACDVLEENSNERLFYELGLDKEIWSVPVELVSSGLFKHISITGKGTAVILRCQRRQTLIIKGFKYDRS
jgi:hypothetical protein